MGVIAIAGIPLCRLLLERRHSLRRIPARAPPARRSGSSAWSPRCSPPSICSASGIWPFFGESRSPDAHPHESPWSMLVPLVILALLSICGGWVGIERFTRSSRPQPALAPEAGRRSLEGILSIVAVAVARWAGTSPRLLPAEARAPGRTGRGAARGYKLLANKYYVDEFYGATVVKPLLAFSTYFWAGSSTRPSSAARPGCLAASPPFAARCCSAGSPAIFAPTPRGWPRAALCCSSSWFPGPRCWQPSEFISTWRGTENERDQPTRFSR
jgi:hypothetical protein